MAETARSATIDKAIKTELEPNTFSLLNSSKELITDLDEFAKEGAENSVFLQKILEFFNITVTTALVLYFIIKILKPVFVLTNATFEVIRGNFNVSVRSKGNDELSVLGDSFTIFHYQKPPIFSRVVLRNILIYKENSNFANLYIEMHLITILFTFVVISSVQLS